MGLLVTQSDLDAVLARNPNLSASGFVETMDGENPVDLGQVDLSIRWLDYHGRRTYVDRRFSSYGLKHAAESVAPALRPGAFRYISNGAFIAAALYLRYHVQRERNGPNARINIRYYPERQAALLDKTNEVIG